MNPPESQKAMAMSQGISEAKAEKAAAKVRVLVAMAAPSPSMATAPRGSGLVMMPTIVPRKMASRRQACGATPEGAGMNQTAAARPTEMPRFFMSAPLRLRLGEEVVVMVVVRGLKQKRSRSREREGRAQTTRTFADRRLFVSSISRAFCAQIRRLLKYNLIPLLLRGNILRKYVALGERGDAIVIVLESESGEHWLVKNDRSSCKKKYSKFPTVFKTHHCSLSLRSAKRTT